MKFVIDKDHYCLMKKICYKYLRSICDASEMDSLIYYTYVLCCKNYDPDRSEAKFSTYICNSIGYNAKKLRLKLIRSREKQTHPFVFEASPKESCSQEVFEIMESLKDIDLESYEVLVQKFMNGMTNSEIGRANGYSRELARQKVKKAIEICREIVYN